MKKYSTTYIKPFVSCSLSANSLLTRVLFILVGLVMTFSVHAQTEQPDSVKVRQKDSLRTYQLQQVEVYGKQDQVEHLKPVHNTYLIGGTKNEVINISTLNANIAEKTGRQLFAKIPGIFVYDMDGSGNQMNIATRGLDPHRSWEYNIRQNFIMTNSDIYGYPASHYSPPMESIQKVELIRGTASLQYGSQFGGMINYITKQTDSTRKVSFESINSAGSYGLFSSYNAIGGRIGKLTYYAYYHKRVSDGYRKNSESNTEAQFISLSYRFSRKVNLKAELGRSTYLYHIPGPLTDAMFKEDPRQSTRSRNYFNPDIYIPSLTLDWHLNETTQLSFITSAVLGSRNSVQIDAFATVGDTINPATNSYKARQVDIDNFNSYTSEIRLLKTYTLGGLPSSLSAGIRYINNDLHRRQLGKGTTASDFDLTLTDPNWGRDLHFKTQNMAVFVENLFRITPKFSVTPGIRYENGVTDLSGKISYYDAQDVPNKIKHHFPLAGLNTQYQINPNHTIYGGWAQAYRPVILKDIIPGSVLERANKDLKDAFGYNAEVGVRGNFANWLYYDVTAFQLLYRNRLGNLILTDPDGTSYIYKTNVGDSRTRGVETYIEGKLIKRTTLQFSVFTSTSYFDARYIKGAVSTGTENQDITGNYVESAPKWTVRNGANFWYKHFSATLQYSYVSQTFSDALNTPTPSANGAKGPVPAYGIWDLNMSMHFGGNYVFRLGINNLANTQYFTKRPTFYPGPGVWSSDGRSIVASFGVRL
ncbi:TonB-dependent receptor [Cytophagaceae bacterium YF14B1]|uniref:TonB-dependent receptor n=1 Tax=Xanthocytophaga flava TaxID=3048013 RepID=A0AAE3U6P1_9BACT|nr:TonB-dependent receptor [Xanthocytophaga flavus]MDJ1480782.1 TonB-dependent receptor [Xanthocytophaga flavus]